MGKADELLKTMGGAILESASHRGAPAAMPTLGQGGPPGGDRMVGVSRSKAALEIPLEKIERDEAQPREEFEAEPLARLAESIRTKGLLQPISVRWVEDRKKYIIVAGERRWRGAAMAGMNSISCVVIDRPLGPGELLALQCIENLIREDLKPIEEAKAFRALSTVNNWSGNQLAKELGISQSSVAQALALLELPEQIQASIDAGNLAPSTAYAIAKLEDPAEQVEVAARVQAEGLSRDETAQVVRQVAESKAGGKTTRARVSKGRGASKGKPKLPSERTMKVDGGFKVTVSGRKGFDVLAWVEVLEDAARQARAKLEPAEQGGETAAA
jgi:ParB family transcriptional regulator, chromosome partitioning protein